MRIMISCGEASGDMYAGALAAELRRRVPDAEIFGFGGPRLKDAGGRLVADYSPLSVTGITEAVKIIPRSFAMLRKLVDAARELRPHDVSCEIGERGFVAFVGSEAVACHGKDRKRQTFDISNFRGWRKCRQELRHAGLDQLQLLQNIAAPVKVEIDLGRTARSF